MTADEARQALVAIGDDADRLDVELAHVEADEILCDLLRALGYGDVVDAWDAVPKWYA